MSMLPQQQGKEGLFADVRRRYKKGQKLLFSRDSACLQPLLDDMSRQNHRTLILWAFDCAQEALSCLEKSCPNDPRPREAMALCRLWAQGSVKMPQARPAILALHAMAKEVSCPVDAALCHAVGHACATVHTHKHAIGLPLYELTAIVLQSDRTGFEQPVLSRISQYHLRLKYFEQQPQRGPWAAFLQDKEQMKQSGEKI